MEELKIPKSLRSFVASYPIQRKRVKVLQLNSTTQTQNGNIRLRLPDRSLIDFSTMTILAEVDTDGGATGSAYVDATYSLVKAMQWTVGGVQIGGAQQYQNQMAHAVNLASRSVECDRANMLQVSYNNLPPAAANDYNAGDTIAINFFPYAGLAAAGVVDSAVFPNIECDIRLEGAECLNIGHAASAVNGYTLVNIRCYVDILLPASPSYAQTMESRLSTAGGVVKKSVPTSVGVVQTQNGTNTFNVSSNSLDAVCVGVKQDAWNTKQIKTDAYTKFLNFSLANTNNNQKLQLELANGEIYPQYGLPDKTTELAEITRAWAGKGSAYNFNKLFYNQAVIDVPQYRLVNYLEQNFLFIAQMGGEGAAVDNGGLHTGIDTRGASAQLKVISQNLAGNDSLFIAGLCSSMMEAKQGGVVAFVQ